VGTYLQCPRRWYYKYRLGLPDPPGPEAQRGIAFHQVVEAFYTGQPLPDMPEDLAAGWQVFHAEIARRVRPLPGWTERWIDFTLAGIPFRGRIDVVDDQLTIRDTKTKKRRPTQEEVNDSLQLTAYWAAVRQVLGDRPKAVAWDLLIWTKTPQATTYLADRTERDVARLEHIVEQVLDAADRGYWWRHWGCLGCATCPYRGRCVEEGD